MATVWLNGSLVDEGEARVSPLDRGLVWGDGLFETLRVYDGRPFAIAEHYERLQAGSRALELRVPDADTVAGAFDAVLRDNRLREAGVRVTVTRGAGPADPHADDFGEPNVLATAWPLRDYSALYDRGAVLRTSVPNGRPVARIKTISYAANVLGRRQAKREGVDDTLFVTADGFVLETTGSNAMIVSGATIATAPVDDGVLPGVTRANVLRVAGEMGLEPVERPVRAAELYAADEVLLTSTLREVYAVCSIDGRDVCTGPIARALRDAFHSHALQSSRD